MKAAYYSGNQSFSIEESPTPSVGADDVNIQVAYCGICGTDMHVYHGVMDARVTTHRIIGHEMSGTVLDIGSNVTGIAPGDKVVVRPLVPCGDCAACRKGHSHVCSKLTFLGLDTDGAFQNQWVVPAATVHTVPADMDMAHAALVEPLAVACHDVRLSRLSAGEDVLVIGGGPIGLLVAMVARHAGGNVTVSEISEFRRGVVESLGMQTIDPGAVEDVGATVYEQTNGKGADVVFEVSGSQAGVDAMTQAAAVRARIVMVAIHASKPQIDLFQFFWREIEMLGARVYEPEDYEKAIELVSSGAIAADSMITDVAELEQIGEAFKSLDGNPRSMKTLIRCSEGGPS